MKKSYIGLAALILIVLVGYSFYPSHEEQTKTLQIAEIEEKSAVTPEFENKPISNTTSEESVTDNQHESKEDKPDITVNESINDNQESNTYINTDAKSLYAVTIRDKISTDNFQAFLDEISIEQSDLDIEIADKVAGILNEQTNLNSYYYTSGCGKGICAVEVKYIPNDEVSEIAESLSELLNFGALVTGIQNDNDGSSNVRLIFASDKNVNSLSFPPGEGVEIRN